MQRISRFLACCYRLDMILLIYSRLQRYNKVLKQQNNLKENIKNHYDTEWQKEHYMKLYFPFRYIFQAIHIYDLRSLNPLFIAPLFGPLNRKL